MGAAVIRSLTHPITVDIACLMLMLACGAPARHAEPAPQPAPWCVAIAAETPDGPGYARVCLDRPSFCELVRDKAISFAGMAHFTTVGACKRD